MQSWCSPIVSASADCIDPLQLLPSLQLLLPTCVRFSCCSPLASASVAAPWLRPLRLLLPDCVRFNCCSPIASASTAAQRLSPLQLLLPDCVRFSCCSPIASNLLLSDCVCSDCCSPIASPGRFQPMPRPNVLEHSSLS